MPCFSLALYTSISTCVCQSCSSVTVACSKLEAQNHACHLPVYLTLPCAAGYKSVAHYLMQTGVQGRNVVAEAAAAAAPTPAAAASAPKPAEGPAPAELPAETEASPGQAPADSAAEPEAPSSLPAPVPAAAPRPARTRASAQVSI